MRSDYYTDAAQVYRQLGKADSFAEIVRRLTLYLLKPDEAEGKKLKAVDEDDRKALRAVNVYLRAEGVPPIEVGAIACVPDDLAKAFLKLLTGPALNQQRHVFNTGADAQDRGRNKKRQAILGDLYAALGEYYDAHYPNREQHQGIKLWKKLQQPTSDGWGGQVQEVSGFDADKHILLRVPGVSNIHKYADRSAYYIAMTQQMLKHNTSNKTQTYCLSFPYQNLLSASAEIHHYNADPEHFVSDKFQDFANDVLLPALGVDDVARRRNLAQLKQAFRHLTLLSHSYGAVAAGQMQNAMRNRLLQLGYDTVTIKQALPEVYHQCYSPVNHIEKQAPKGGMFSTFYVASSNDLTPLSRCNVLDFAPTSHQSQGNVVINEHTLMRWAHAPVSGYSKVMQQEENKAGEAPLQIPQKGHSSVLVMHDIEQPDGKVYRNTLTRYALGRAIARSETHPDLVKEWAGKIRMKNAHKVQDAERKRG